MELNTLLPSLSGVDEWITFAVASGASPRSLSNLPLNQWHDVDRHDWNSWKSGISQKLERKPSFSDYVTRDPGASPDGGRPSVSLRYALSKVWRVRVGRKFGEGFSGDMHVLCADLVSKSWYSGAGFSEGDAMLNEVALENIGPGAPQQWLQWAMNHHIVFTHEEIQAI